MKFPSSLFRIELRLRFSDIDSAHIAYFARFPSFFDESFNSAMKKHGISWHEHKEQKFKLPIIEQKTRFFYPLEMGDLASIYMGAVKIGNRSFRTQHIITVEKNGETKIVATGYISRVTVDYDTFKPIAIPDVIMNILTSYKIDSEELTQIDARLEPQDL